MRRIVEFRGFKIDFSRQIEKIKPQAKMSGVDVDKMTDQEALIYASHMLNQSVPEFLGIEQN